MGNWQYSYVERKSSESGQASTATYDLPEKDYCADLVVGVHSTLTASTNPTPNLEELITKIEVMDGGTVIKSLNGRQARALSMFHGNHQLSLTGTEDNAVEGYDEFIIPFGFFYRDTKHMLNMDKLANPQIKITWDASGTAGEHGEDKDADADPAIKLTVLADMYRGVPPGGVEGYIRSNQIKQFTQAASTSNDVSIPRDQPLVGILVEAGYKNLDWTEDVEEIKLDFDHGSWIPFHFYEEQIVPIQRLWHGGDFEVSFMKDLIDNKTIDARMGYVTDISITPASDIARAVNWQGSHTGVDIPGILASSSETADTTYSQYYVQVKGQMPFQCWYMPVNVIQDGNATSIDLSKYGDVTLTLTSGASASTSSKPKVLVEQLIRQ